MPPPPDLNPSGEASSGSSEVESEIGCGYKSPLTHPFVGAGKTLERKIVSLVPSLSLSALSPNLDSVSGIARPIVTFAISSPVPITGT